MIFIEKDPNRDFLILNFSDPQLTDSEWNEDAGAIVTGTVKELTERVRPDLITLSGDLAWAGHRDSYARLADLMESCGVPWAPVFGNHDNQNGQEEVDSTLEIFSARKGFLFERGDPSLGCGNYVIAITEGGKPLHAVFMTDTHNLKPAVSPEGEAYKDWSDLNAEQIAWYEKTAAALKADGCPETTVIMHIPCYSFRQAFAAALKPGIDPLSVDPTDGAQTECWNEGYEDSFGVAFDGVSSYPVDNGFLDSVIAVGSTKTIICGHNHTTDFSVPYRGVRHVFSLKVGPGCFWDEKLNGGTVVRIDSNGHAEARHEFVDPVKFMKLS